MDRADILQFIQRVKESKATAIDLSNKGITELPDEICELLWVKSIDLSYNNLTELPAKFSNLENLEKLYLLRNNILKLPSGFGNLSKLKTLDISYNPISRLPREVGFIYNLEFLDASYCDLKILPLELNNLYCLKHLNLEENPLEFPPQKVVKRGLYAIMHFLTIERRKKEASRVMVQIFNMPEKIQGSFREYIKYFSQMVSSANQKEVIFDTNFVNQDFYQEMDLNASVESYLYDVIRYVHEKVELIKSANTETDLEEHFVNQKINDIKSHLNTFNQSLNDKINEIRHIKRELKNLYSFLDENNKTKK